MRYFVEYKRGAFRFVAGYATCEERDAKAAELVITVAPCGEAHGRAKLTDRQVAHARLLAGVAGQRAIARLFGVTPGYISKLHRMARRRVST